MKIKTTLNIFASSCLLFTAVGFYAQNEHDPEKLGIFRAQIDDAGLLQMTLDQLRTGLKSGRNEQLFLLLANDFHKKDAEFTSKYSPAGQNSLPFSNEKDIYDSIISQNLPKIKIRTTDVTIEGNKATVSAILKKENSDEKFHTELRFKKINQQWKLVASNGLFSGLDALSKIKSKLFKDNSAGSYELYRASEQPENQTLLRRAMSEEHGIDKLSRKITKEKLNRRLFQKPYAGVLFSSIIQRDSAPYFTAKYLQLVTDPAWNRIVYGNYDGWVKAYGNSGNSTRDLNRPHGIDRDVEGNIYIADTGNNRLVVLKVERNGEASELKFKLAFGSGLLSQPYDVAWDDAGTPFDTSDDIIWSTDTGNHRIIGFTLNSENATARYIYGTYGKTEGAFFNPKSVTVGRFNGAADGSVYIADSGNRRIVKLIVNADQLEWVGSFSHKDETQFTSLTVDHWGNLYATDRSFGEILKLRSDLRPITTVAGTDQAILGLANLSVVFGSVYIQSEDKHYWAGYDQAFSIEKWSDATGARRFQLGVDLEDFSISLSRELDEVRTTATLTDHARLSLNIIAAKTGQTVRQIPAGWKTPGQKELSWRRRDENGEQVKPGFYRFQLIAGSGYGALAVNKESPVVYVPLYYHEDSGAGSLNDPHLVQGFPNSDLGLAPHLTYASHPSEVVYHFADLNPTVDYEISAEFNNEAGYYLKQRITVDNNPVQDVFIVPAGLKRVEWKTLPRVLFADGEIDVGIEKVSGNTDAMIAQLWLREANFDPMNTPVLSENENQVPEIWSLSQNYPNPFNPSTTIGFVVPVKDSFVQLRIYNMLGQTVKVLVNEELPAGRHSVVWNGRDALNRAVASGVYFYQLTAGDFNRVKKLIIMK